MRLLVRFAKREGARFLSHLDLLATLEFAIRRAQLPVELSAGFNPRPKIALAAPLPVGYVGRNEILELSLRESMPIEDVVRRMQEALPPGLEIIAAEELQPGKSLGARVRAAHYTVHLAEPVPDLAERVGTLMASDRAEIEEWREEKLRRRNVRPLLESVEVIAPQRLGIVVDLTGGSVRPEQVLQLLGIDSSAAQMTRDNLELA